MLQLSRNVAGVIDTKCSGGFHSGFVFLHDAQLVRRFYGSKTGKLTYHLLFRTTKNDLSLLNSAQILFDCCCSKFPSGGFGCITFVRHHGH